MKAEVSIPTKLFKVRENEVVSQVIDDEAIIINMTTGCYYSLDKVGAEIWSRIGLASTVAEIVGMLEAQYDCAEADVTTQVEKLLMELEAEQLIEHFSDEPQRESSRVADPHGSQQEKEVTLASFENPRFEKHSDMRDFLLIDPIHQVDDRGWPHKDKS